MIGNDTPRTSGWVGISAFVLVVPRGAVVALCVAGAAAACGLLLRRRRRRREADERDGVFRCKIRPAGGLDGTRAAPRGAARAHWVHDVLIVRTGRIVHRTHAFPVRTAHGHVDDTLAPATDGACVSLQLGLDDGSMIRVAVRSDDADLLVGPFLTAQATIRRYERPAAG